MMDDFCLDEDAEVAYVAPVQDRSVTQMPQGHLRGPLECRLR